MQLDSHAIADMPSQKRAAFVNSVTGFKSANLVGTATTEGATNLAIMSSVVHLGSHPPLVALIIRPGGEERHTLAVLVTNEPGVLARVIGLFSGRGYNIESLTVAPVNEDESMSRITIVTSGTPMIIVQMP